MWERGLRGNNAPCSAVCQLSVTSATTHQQIGPFWCWFPGGWFFVCSRTLWVSPTNSPVRLGVSPTAATPTGFFQSEVLRLYFPAVEPWVCSLSHSPVVPPSYLHANVGLHALPAAASPSLPAAALDAQVLQLPPCHESSLPQLPVSTLPTSLDECFFFNYLVVRLPYSSIFW